MSANTTSRGPVSIGDLSRATGCNVETIRYYERIGLLPRPPRTAGGRRVYGPPHAAQLVFIMRARGLGFSQSDVRALLALAAGGIDCDGVRDMTLRRLGDVRAKIADLRRLEATLAEVAARCKGGRAPKCPIIDALSGSPAPARRAAA